MSRKGDCWDNAPMESFFGSMEQELLLRTVFHTREDARLAIFEYIEVFYNRKRIHSSIGFQSPVDFEETNMPFPCYAFSYSSSEADRSIPGRTSEKGEDERVDHPMSPVGFDDEALDNEGGLDKVFELN